jgi:thiol-disulfide isomerase/thioredoxin
MSAVLAYIKSNFFTLALLCFVLGYIAYTRLPAYLETRALHGQVAPDLELATLNAGAGAESPVFRIAEQRGRKTLLVFWATWCSFCVAEMPDLNALQKELAPAGLSIVAITEESPDTVRAYLEKEPVAFPVALDALSAAHRAYRISLYPTLVWVEADGRVSDVSQGQNYGLKYRVRYWVTGSALSAGKTAAANAL